MQSMRAHWYGRAVKNDARRSYNLPWWCVVSGCLLASCNLVASFPDAEEENIASLCEDGRDNDFDGAADCRDPDCISFCIDRDGLDLTQVCLQVAPWGTRQDQSPRAAIVGRPGAAVAGTVVYIYDEDGAQSALRTATVAADGHFSVPLPAPSGPRPAPYRIVSVPSEAISSSVAREVAEPVRCVNWTASVVGRDPGLGFNNPNRLVLGPVGSSSLRSSVQTTEPSESELAAIGRGEGRVSAAGALRWRRQGVSQRPEGRLFAAMAYDGVRGEVVMLGGITGLATDSETWVWRQDGWSLVPNAEGPSRARGFLVPVPGSEDLVYVGGVSAVQVGRETLAQDQWRWNGSRWRRDEDVSERLPAAKDRAAAYDEARGRVVAFGGCGVGGLPSEPLACSNVLGDTWEYDGNSWTAASVEGDRPPARHGAAMVYDPVSRRVVMHGGIGDDGRALGDFWAYDGRRWQALPVDPEIGPRAYHIAAVDAQQRVVLFRGTTELGKIADPRVWAWDGSGWTGIESLSFAPKVEFGGVAAYEPASGAVVVFGGVDDASPSLSDRTFLWAEREWVEALPPSGLRPTAAVGAAASYHDAADAVYLFGGLTEQDDRRQIFSDVLWRLTDQIWVRLPQQGPSARAFHGMSYDSTRQRLLVFGGRMAGNTRANDLWSWTVPAGWQRLDTSGPSPRPRESAAMAFDPVRNQLVVFGGRVGETELVGDTWIYDESGEWRQHIQARGPLPRVSGRMVFDEARGVIVLTGGVADGRSLSDTWTFDGSQWSRGPANTARTFAGFTLHYDSSRRRVILIEGCSDAECDVIGNGRYVLGDENWEFDGGVPFARADSATAYHRSRSELYIVGGRSEASRFRDTVFIFDGDQWRVQTPDSQVGSRCEHAAAEDDSGRGVFLFGGCRRANCSVGLNDLWRWNGFGWTSFGSGATVPPRHGHSLTSFGDGRWVLYGGLSGNTFSVLSDLYVFDGSDWRAASLPGPGPSWGHAATFDGQRVLLSGGAPEGLVGPSEARDALWAFDGRRSVQIPTSGGPGARTQHVMVYDPVRQTTVLHGGSRTIDFGPLVSPPTPLRDTWEFGEQRWVLAESDGPALIDSSVAYDPQRGRIMMFGGLLPSGLSTNTLRQWEHGRWLPIPVVGAVPSVRFRHTLTADSRRGGLMLHGGVGAEFASDCLDDTWVLSTDPQQRPHAQFAVKWTATGLDTEGLQEIRIDLAASGQGFEVNARDAPRTVSGVRVSAWNTRARKWDPVGTLEDAPTPTTVVITETPADYASASGDLNIRVEPAAGWGSSPIGPSIAISAIEVSLLFERDN